MRKRSQRKLRPLRAPVTQALSDDMVLNMKSILMAFDMGYGSQKTLSELNGLLHMVRVAVRLSNREQPEAWLRRLDTALAHVVDVAARFDRTGQWHMSPLDRGAILEGTRAAESMLPRVGVEHLWAAHMMTQATENTVKELG